MNEKYHKLEPVIKHAMGVISDPFALAMLASILKIAKENDAFFEALERSGQREETEALQEHEVRMDES